MKKYFSLNGNLRASKEKFRALNGDFYMTGTIFLFI
jgi:hypothetical protein